MADPVADSGDAEVALTAGGRTTVHRRGQVVHREAGPWSATVLTPLRHLEEVGFAGAPRVVGSGFDPAGRETLTFLEGEFVRPGPWSDDAAGQLGVLLRSLHEATASFRPPSDALWRPWFGPLWAVAWRTRSAAWMMRHRRVLERALG